MEIGSITESIVSQAVNPEIINNASESIEAESSAPQVDDWSQKLALLAKKERGLLEKQKSWQQKLKDIEEKEKKFSEWEQLDRLATENPSEFFKKKGLKFEDLQDKMLASLTDEEIDPIQKQLKELKTQLSAKDEEYKKLLEEKFAEQDSLKKNQEIEEQSKYYNAELKKHIANSGEKYELIQTFGAADEVFNVIKQVYLKTLERGAPKLMTFDDGCELMEKELEKTLHGMAKSNKVKKLLGVNADEDFFGSKVMGQFTLDDSFSQSSANSPELKTEEERLRAAAKLFEQQLKSF
jgi:DNA repair exonuclease SbcCD ATPase subunit